MISISSHRVRRSIGLAALGAALVGLVIAPTPASARVWIGFGFPLYVGPPAYYAPPPVYYPPPAYYPPPVSYAQPPASYAQPPSAYAQPPGAASGATQAGQACYAGSYVCPMDRPVASGSSCYCPANDGSRAWGHAS